MNTITATASTNTILAIHLGKYKSVGCVHDHRLPRHVSTKTPSAPRKAIDASAQCRNQEVDIAFFVFAKGHDGERLAGEGAVGDDAGLRLIVTQGPHLSGDEVAVDVMALQTQISLIHQELCATASWTFLRRRHVGPIDRYSFVNPLSEGA